MFSPDYLTFSLYHKSLHSSVTESWQWQNTSAIVWGLTKVDIYIEQIVKASVFVRVREINFKDEHEEMRT